MDINSVTYGLSCSYFFSKMFTLHKLRFKHCNSARRIRCNRAPDIIKVLKQVRLAQGSEKIDPVKPSQEGSCVNDT